jgi:hypothetical protein
MSVRRIARGSALLAGGALALVLTAACQGQSGAAGSTGSAGSGGGATVAPSTAAGSGGAATGSGGGNSGSAGGAGSAAGKGGGASGSGGKGGGGGGGKSDECKANELKVTEGQGNGGAAGSTYPAVQFTNTGSRTCVLQGFPGVSYVTGDSGQQVGGAASRDGSIGAGVKLKPGAMASSVVKMAETGNYDPAQCKPVAVRGLRIYAPDDTAALFLPLSGATACSSTAIPGGTQLSVQTVEPGSGTS